MMTNEEYVDRDGKECPYCKADNVIASGGLDIDGTVATCIVGCVGCGKRWSDIFVLTSFKGK